MWVFCWARTVGAGLANTWKWPLQPRLLPHFDARPQALCCGYLLALANKTPELLPPLGGLDALATALVTLIERALAAGAAWPSQPHASASGGHTNQQHQQHPLVPPAAAHEVDGRGVDVSLLEAAVRGLAWLAGSGNEGRVAVTAAHGVRRLVAVVRADNAALAAVRERREADGEWQGLGCGAPVRGRGRVVLIVSRRHGGHAGTS